MPTIAAVETWRFCSVEIIYQNQPHETFIQSPTSRIMISAKPSLPVNQAFMIYNFIFHNAKQYKNINVDTVTGRTYFQVIQQAVWLHS